MSYANTKPSRIEETLRKAAKKTVENESTIKWKRAIETDIKYKAISALVSKDRTVFENMLDRQVENTDTVKVDAIDSPPLKYKLSFSFRGLSLNEKITINSIYLRFNILTSGIDKYGIRKLGYFVNFLTFLRFKKFDYDNSIDIKKAYVNSLFQDLVITGITYWWNDLEKDAGVLISIAESGTKTLKVVASDVESIVKK